MAVDPDVLPNARSNHRAVGATLAEDRACIKCGYNLRGLETHGACPECGTAITPRRDRSKRFADNLVNSEMWYLKALALGLGLMAAAVVGTWVLWIGVWMGTIPVALGNIVALALALAWFVASWISTTERPHTESTVKDEILDSDPLRKAARFAQALAVLAVLADAARYWTGSPVFAALSGLVSVAFLFGLVPLGIYLSSLADWAGETNVGSRLRTAAWCTTVCGSLAVIASVALLMPVPFKLLIAGALTILSIIVLIGLVLFCASTVQLAHTAFWAITNSHQSQEREIRMAERKRRQAEADAARATAADIAMADTANPHQQAVLEDDSPIAVEGLEHTEAVKPEQAPTRPPPPAGDLDTYELADD